MAKTPLREISRNSYTSEPTLEAINSGSLQRIADATELMAKNYLQLQDDAERYRKWWLREQEENADLKNKITALKGVVTKLKRKLAAKDQGVTV